MEPRRPKGAFGLARIQEKSVCQLERQESMDLGGVIAIALKMSVDNFSDRFRIDIWTRQRFSVKQHLADVIRKIVAIPHPEMKHLVTAQPDSL